MASFPDSIFSPASKNTGDTIQASHVTDLDGEVVAIEQGLRNGTAPLNSSNSTLTALSVSGNSTFTGSVVFSSLVTATAQPRCLVYSTAAQPLPAGAFTAITFEVEEFDVGGLHSTASNPGRITIPAGSSGLYLVGASIRFAAGSAPINVRLLKNSTTEVGGSEEGVQSSAAQVTLSPQVPMVLDGGDFVTVEAFPTGSTASVPAVTVRRGASEFWAVKVW